MSSGSPSENDGTRHSLGQVAKGLGSDCPETRAGAVWALGEFRWLALPYLMEALRDRVAEVRKVAAATIGEMAEEARDALEALTPALNDTDPEVREEVAATIGRIGVPDARAVQLLAEGLRSERLGVCAAVALGELGPAGLMGLRAGLGHRDPQIRAASLAGLGQSPDLPPATLSEVRSCLDDPEAIVRVEAIRTLGRVAPDHQEVTSELARLARRSDEEPDLRRQAASVLGEADPTLPAVSQTLKELENDADSRLSRTAAQALTRLEARRSSPGVRESNLDDHYLQVGLLSSFQENRAIPICLEGQEILIVRRRERVFALENRCSHAGARLSDGVLDDATISCPKHWARFDLTSGRDVCPPARRPVRSFPVRVIEDRVEIGLPSHP